MSDEDATPREVLSRAIMSTATDELDGCPMLGFVTVVEWMAPDGRRWLSHVSGNPDGYALPDWTAQGYLTNVLGGDLPSWVSNVGADGDDDSDTDAV